MKLGYSFAILASASGTRSLAPSNGPTASNGWKLEDDGEIVNFWTHVMPNGKQHSPRMTSSGLVFVMSSDMADVPADEIPVVRITLPSISYATIDSQ